MLKRQNEEAQLHEGKRAIMVTYHVRPGQRRRNFKFLIILRLLKRPEYPTMTFH